MPDGDQTACNKEKKMNSDIQPGDTNCNFSMLLQVFLLLLLYCYIIIIITIIIPSGYMWV